MKNFELTVQFTIGVEAEDDIEAAVLLGRKLADIGIPNVVGTKLIDAVEVTKPLEDG